MKNIREQIEIELDKMLRPPTTHADKVLNSLFDNHPWFDELNTMAFYVNL